MPSTSSRIQTWPPTSFTLQWFVEAAGNPEIVAALKNSIDRGERGNDACPGARHARVARRAALRLLRQADDSFIFVLPLALPGVITGIALRTSYTTFGIDLGLMTIILGHATFCVVVIYNNVLARLRRVPRTAEEASADLGADSFTTFRRVTLPGMRTALLAGALLAFGLSFDEIIVTIFTAGAGTQTIPMWIYGAIQRPNELPVVNVVSPWSSFCSASFPVYLAQRLSGDVANASL